MVRRFKNHMLPTSLALAAAGILTCVAALLDVFLPRGTFLAFVGWLAATGVAIAAVMISFAWNCEKADERSRLRRRHNENYAGDWPRAVTSARGGRPAVVLDRLSRPASLPKSRPIHNYPVTLRGLISPGICGAFRFGRGQ